MIADRCEINRQIRADNQMLRELKAQVEKLAQAVKNSIPVIDRNNGNYPKSYDLNTISFTS